MIGLRASPETRAAVEKWAERQPDEPSLSEAIRRLVDLGLAKDPGEKPARKPVSRTGASVAGKMIEAAGLGKSTKK